MEIVPCEPADIDRIFQLYETATAYQRAVNSLVVWPAFDRELVAQELREGRQWKIVLDNQLACVWAITFDDPDIWGERNADPAVYIHRLATDPAFRGRHLTAHMVAWAKAYARQHGKRYVRLDTVGDNKPLIAHYQASGFNYLGLRQLGAAAALPAHYHHAAVSLFELTA